MEDLNILKIYNDFFIDTNFKNSNVTYPLLQLLSGLTFKELTEFREIAINDIRLSFENFLIIQSIYYYRIITKQR